LTKVFMTIFDTLAIQASPPLSATGSHQSHAKWQEEEDLKNVWLFLKNGWVDQAVDVITKPNGTGWHLYNTSYELDARGSSRVSIGLIHAWASAPEHVNDRTFLERWQAEFGDVTGEALMKKYDEKASGWQWDRSIKIKDGVVRLAAASRRWNKVGLLLEMGAPWGIAHADAVLEVTGHSYNRPDSLSNLKAFLSLPNVKEWINTPIRGRGYENPTALVCALESETEEAKEVVPLLLAAGADINAPMYDGNTILHLVMGPHGREPYKTLAKRIIKLGGDLSRRNDEGITPVGAWLKRRRNRRWSAQEHAEKEREWLMMQTVQKAPELKAKKASLSAL
jgi:hypothetical protein